MNSLPLNFTEIPRTPDEYFYLLSTSKSHPSPSPSQITQFYLNKFSVLSTVLNRHFTKETLTHFLGEIQLSFILFMIGQNFEAFEVWKNQFALLTKISLINFSLEKFDDEEWLILNFPKFWQSAVMMIFNMVKQFPHDFFYDILTRENFISEALHNFFDFNKDLAMFYQQSPKFLAQGKILEKRLGHLEKLLKTKFNFEINDVDDVDYEDHPPVVVENPTEFYKF